MVDSPWGPLPLADVEFPVRRGKFIDVEVIGSLSAGGTITGGSITGGTITGSTVDGGTIIGSVFYSDNWVSGGGTVPLSLPDGSATTGFAIDGTAGIAQFKSIYADGGFLGELTLSSGGAVWTNAASNYRLKLSSDGLQAYDTSDSLVNTMSINSEGLYFSDRIYTTGLDVAVNGSTYDLKITDGFTGTYNTHVGQMIFDASFTGIGTTGGNGDVYQYNAKILIDPDPTGFLGALPVEFMRFKYNVNNTYGPSYDRSTPQILVLSNTTATNPDLAFLGDTDTGMYRVGTNEIGFSTGATQRLSISSAGLRTVDGSASAPAFSFISDTDTGLYLRGTGEIGFSSGTTLIAAFGSYGLNIVSPSGTASAPSIYWGNDSNTGLYRAAENQIGFTTGGTNRFLIGDGVVAVNANLFRLPVKTSAGDPTATDEGDMYVNTSSNTVRVYADAAWRTIASW